MRVSTIHKFVVLYLLSFLAIFQRWNYCNNNSDLLPGRTHSKFQKWDNYQTWITDFEWTIWYNHGIVLYCWTWIRYRSTRFGLLQIFRYQNISPYSLKSVLRVWKFLLQIVTVY